MLKRKAITVTTITVLLAVIYLTGPVLAQVTHLYSLYPSGYKLTKDGYVTFTIDPTSGQEQIVGVHEGDLDYMIASPASDNEVGVYKGQRQASSSWWESIWREYTNNKVNCEIRWEGDAVKFYVDGTLRFSFTPSQSEYDILVNNVNVNYHAPQTTTSPTTTSTDQKQNAGTINLGNPMLLIGAGLIAMLVVAVFMINKRR